MHLDSVVFNNTESGKRARTCDALRKEFMRLIEHHAGGVSVSDLAEMSCDIDCMCSDNWHPSDEGYREDWTPAALLKLKPIAKAVVVALREITSSGEWLPR